MFFLSVFQINAQENWQKISKTNYTKKETAVFSKKHFPKQYNLVSLNLESFSSNIKSKSKKTNNIIELPDANGELQKFRVIESSNFEVELQEKFPEIKSYSAQGIDDPTAIAKISMGTDGFHGVIFSGHHKTTYIDPYSKNNQDYIVYNRSSISKEKDDFECIVEETASKELAFSEAAKNADDGKLRTFRLALVCSGEYAQFHLTRQNISSAATDAVKKAAVLSAMNTSMSRINGVFEKDLSVKLVIVGNNDDVIFLDEDTDNITDGNADTMIDEVQSICDSQIGSSNYDIGHIFSVGGDGLAGLGVVCIAGQKARGVTGIAAPVGDPYDIDYVVHEMGHQFGATHTQNNDCNRTSSTAVEPGSGSTIMGYAGICTPNVIGTGSATGNSDDYFHAVSIAQMWSHIQTSGSCAVTSNTNNTAPTANAGLDYSIPKSTPFKLEGVATDTDGLTSLTYNWEQIDNEVFLDVDDNPVMPPMSVNDIGPMFRSLPSKTTPVRYMPELATIIAGNSSTTWEVLPSVARDLNFSFLVRDNNVGGGSTARDDVKITVTDATAFTVNTPNSAVIWDVGSTQNITWNNGTTNQAPINCSSVNIRLSTDGGITFPILLKTNTSNDGSESIIIPDNATSSARIMVEAADNIFYNVNSTNFTIKSTTPTFVLNNSSGTQIACNSGNETIDYTLNFDFVNGFSETVTLSATGQPSGSAVTFNPTTINNDGNVTMSVSNLDGKTAQDYIISVLGSSISVTQSLDVDLKLTSQTFNTLNLTSPTNGATNIVLTGDLIWDANSNATSYDVQIATEAGFTNIVSSGNVATNLYTTDNLSGLTEYFWRVKPKNDCGEGSYSTVYSFTTFSPSYCGSTFTDDAGGAEHIQNVTFGSINNTSNNDILDGYEDFTTLNTNVLRGDTSQISVTFDTAGFQDHCYVFIDWNQDFIFDNDTERYDLGSETEDVGTRTFNITVPSDARFGQTRMRVIIEYDDPTNGFGLGACDSDHLTEWGETEDYSVTVAEIGGYSILTTSETCVDENDGIIQIENKQDNLIRQLLITGPSTNINQSFNSSNFSLFDVAPGDYEICITTNSLEITNCFEVTIKEAQPISLKLTTAKSLNTYSFKIEEGTPPFNVYLNSELIAVSSEKEFDLEINKTGKLEVKTAKECEGLFKKSIGEVILKQNPVSSFIELQLPMGIEKTMIETTVFDINGKLIFRKEFKRENDVLQIPFKEYVNGFYILKLSLENATPIKILKQ
ncbi:reprolysin-like metallopeptidase [Polaribacter reichenbachii]|uniref:reprolysin-like metallopeptidase n=1 Tax=Polaribacter reichenbachii TaxID=996801 RepID=UPI001D000B30|nr:zinc-dependent metalloprotease family protein [Polaribacter reichenbachii]